MARVSPNPSSPHRSPETEKDRSSKRIFEVSAPYVACCLLVTAKETT